MDDIRMTELKFKHEGCGFYKKLNTLCYSDEYDNSIQCWDVSSIKYTSFDTTGIKINDQKLKFNKYYNSTDGYMTLLRILHG